MSVPSVASTPIPKSVIIAGAGIVGAATAYYLAGRGVKVELLDSHSPASGATGAADGAVSVASKRPGAMMEAALSGVALYRQLWADGLLDGLFKQRSTFIIAASEAEGAVLEAHARALKQAGIDVEVLSGVVLRSRFAALSPGALLGLEVRGDGHAIGYQIVHRLLTAAGIVVRRGVRVERIITGAGGLKVEGVETSQGLLHADAVVIASGGGSAKLLDFGQVLRPRKGQLLITERAPRLNAAMPGAIMSGRYLMSKGSQQGAEAPSARGYGLVIDPLVTGQFLIGGTREEQRDQPSNDVEAVTHILRDATALVPDLARLRLLRAFAGVRTAVKDSLPIVGRVPNRDGLFVATGFEGDGICLGPIMGKSIANLICGARPDLDLAPFDPARFGELEKAA